MRSVRKRALLRTAIGLMLCAFIAIVPAMRKRAASNVFRVFIVVWGFKINNVYVSLLASAGVSGSCLRGGEYVVCFCDAKL